MFIKLYDTQGNQMTNAFHRALIAREASCKTVCVASTKCKAKETSWVPGCIIFYQRMCHGFPHANNNHQVGINVCVAGWHLVTFEPAALEWPGPTNGNTCVPLGFNVIWVWDFRLMNKLNSCPGGGAFHHLGSRFFLPQR